MKLDLHLVSWNRPKMTELVVRTIKSNTKDENYRLVVLDNGSDKETVDTLTRLHDGGLIDELHLMEENMGLEGARQWLFYNSYPGEYFICVDNDCLPPKIKEGKDWTERLLELMQKYEGYGAISCRTQVMIGTGNIFDEADKAGQELVDFPHPGGSLRIMNTRAVIAVGGWDRQNPGRGAEERYIGGKLNTGGWKTAFATNIRCLHLFGTREDNPTDRWGYDKDWTPEQTGHSDIWHPALQQGDIKDEVLLYAEPKDVEDYFGNSRHTTQRRTTGSQIDKG